jgi:phage-related protein
MPLAILGAIGKSLGQLALKGAQKAAIGAGKLALKGARKAGSLALKGAKRLGKSAIKKVGKGIKNAFSKRSQKPGTPNDPDKGQKGKGSKCANDEICKTINDCFAALAKTVTPLQANTNNLTDAFQSANKSTIKLSKIKQYLVQNYKALIGSVLKFLNPINLLSRAIKLSIKLFYKMASSIVKLSLSIVKYTAKLAPKVIGSILPLASAFGSLGSQMMGLVQKISNIGQTILDTFTGIPGKLESMFGGITSLIKSYSPAQAKQIEIAFGQLRATMGRVLVPLAPMIKNIVLNIAKLIKDGASKIDIKKVFKWIVFFMFLTVGVIIAGVKLVIAIIQKIRSIFQGGGQGIVAFLLDLQRKIFTIVVAVWRWILDFLKTIGPQIAAFIGYIFDSIGPLVQQAVEMLGPIIGEAIDLIVQAFGWLLRQLPSWIGKLLELLLQGVTWLVQQLPGWLMKLSEYALDLMLDLAEGLVNAIVEYVPKLWDQLLNLLESLWEFVKQSWRNFINYLPQAISKIANRILNILPGWAKRLLGISGSAEAEEQPPQQQPPPQQQQQPAKQDQSKASDQKQGGGGLLDKLGTPEGAMKGIANFFNELGLEDVGAVFSDMSNMFQKMFEEPGDTSDLSYEAKEGTTTSIEDIGKKAREAALTVNEDPQKRTADATEQTSQNTSAINQGLQALAGALAGGGLNQLAQQADANAKAIQALHKTNKEGVEAGKQDQMVMVKGMEAMLQQQAMTNELLMRMANSQKQVAEIERSKTYSFGSLNNKSK